MKTLLVLAVLLGFGAAGALVWNHLRNRPEVAISLFHPDDAPYADAMRSGFKLALKESAGRAGRVRVTHGSDTIIVGAINDLFFIRLGDWSKGPIDVAPLSCPDREPLAHILAGPQHLAKAAFAWAEREGLKVTQLLTEPDDKRSLLLESAIRTAWKERASGEALVLHAGESAPFSAAARTYRELKASGFKGRFLVFDAHPEVSCVDAPGQPEDGMLLVTPIFPPPADFIPRYRAYAHKDPGPHVYGGYLAGKAALDLIARARSTSPEDLLSAASSIRPHPPALYVARGGRFHFVELLSFPTR